MENLLPQGSAKKDTTHSEKQLGNKHLGNMHPMEPPFPSCMHFLKSPKQRRKREIQTSFFNYRFDSRD